MTLPRYAPVLPDVNQLQHLMEVACEAADAAAQVTGKYFRQDFAVENKAAMGSFDPVTVADREAELAIRRVLREKCPDIGFYGEEHEAIASDNGLMWVVDPIDGTRAFMSGLPLWGTLIGLYNGRDAILGLMDQPFFQERYQAYDNNAQLITAESTRTLSARHVPELSDAVAYCTTPDMFSDDTAMACFNRVKEEVQLMRYGGDCYAYALLAAGYIDLVLDCDLKPYDIQALIPIVAGAGGVVSNWSGDSAVDGGYVVACGSQTLHDKVLPLLKMQANINKAELIG
ncbi:MAG: histidinol-phosphatase [Granulosicoccus sp.]